MIQLYVKYVKLAYLASLISKKVNLIMQKELKVALLALTKLIRPISVKGRKPEGFVWLLRHV